MVGPCEGQSKKMSMWVRVPNAWHFLVKTKRGVHFLERGNYRIRVYLSLIQHKSLEIICNPKVITFTQDDAGINVRDLESV